MVTLDGLPQSLEKRRVLPWTLSRLGSSLFGGRGSTFCVDSRRRDFCYESQFNRFRNEPVTGPRTGTRPTK